MVGTAPARCSRGSWAGSKKKWGGGEMISGKLAMREQVSFPKVFGFRGFLRDLRRLQSRFLWVNCSYQAPELLLRTLRPVIFMRCMCALRSGTFSEAISRFSLSKKSIASYWAGRMHLRTLISVCLP